MTLDIPQDITALHIVLAYLGLTIHVLAKLKSAYSKDGFTWKNFVKFNIITVIASTLMIPVLLILLCDPAIKTTLPLNNITAMLAGYQTNSVFKTLMSFYPSKKSKSSDSSSEENTTNPDDIG